MKKKCFSLILAMALSVIVTASLIACSDGDSNTVAVIGVELNQKSISLFVGDDELLMATVLPAEATNKQVTWKSSNPAVAEVDSTGKITTKKKGRITISVTTEDGEKTASCTVSVLEPVFIDNLSLNTTKTWIMEGYKRSLQISMKPANASDKSIKWVSSDENVATVTDGVITAKKVGEATITATSETSNKQATCTAIVVADPEKKDSLPITITGGQISGYTSDILPEGVTAYKGIPYAAAPIGQNRWKAPQDVEAWDGVKTCRQYGPSAMQGHQYSNSLNTDEFMIFDTETYSEDCLTLNVWSNAQTNTQTADKPVLLYFHGGAWIAGGSSCELYEGANIAAQDVVYVSVNYRLGIFGALARTDLAKEDSEGSSGNYGLMDLVKSLEWVQANISAFGGNKNNVTIMGGSAGASMVNALMISPKANSLFHHAVSMSFNDLAGMFGGFNTLESVCPQGDKMGNLDDLRALSSEEVLALGGLWLKPNIDGIYLTKDYGDALEEGIGKDIDLMLGMVWSDGLSGDTQFIMSMLEHANGATAGECLIAASNSVAKARNIKYSANTYIYEFTHVLPGPNSDENKAFHGSDTGYFLNNFTHFRKDYWTDMDFAIGQSTSGYLVNFCKTGNPNGQDAKGKSLANWNKWDSGTEFSYMNLKYGSEVNYGGEFTNISDGTVTKLQNALRALNIKNDYI